MYQYLFLPLLSTKRWHVHWDGSTLYFRCVSSSFTKYCFALLLFVILYLYNVRIQYIIATDWLLLPIYLGFILMIGILIKGRIKHPVDKKYFMWGLYAKLFGAIAFASIYAYNYGGGDTTSYHKSAHVLINLSHYDFNAFWQLMKGNMEAQYLTAFTADTGYPLYRHDPQAFAANRFLVPFVWLGAKRFLLSTVVLSFFMYLVVFRFYRFLSDLYPDARRNAAIAVLFVQSVLFWSSGILKDSFTFSFALLCIVSLYHLIIKPQKILRYLLYLIFSAYIVLSLKPYIFFALFVAALIWLLLVQSKRIKNVFLKTVGVPAVSALIIIGGIFAINQLGSFVGGYYTDIDKVAKQAVVIQDDLSRATYGENSFDIGNFDPSFSGMLSKFPQAVMAGLYRPFLWESGNLLMIFSGLENILLLLLSLYVLLRAGPLKFIKQVFSDPFIAFCLIYAIILSFFIGLTTANFGALVRYRIPMLPFFTFALIMICFNTKKLKIKLNK